MFISFKNYTLNTLPFIILLNKIFFKFKSRNFTLLYSHNYNIYNNYFNKSIIYNSVNFNYVFNSFF